MSISILKGLHRRALGLSHDNEVVAKDGIVVGGEGKPAVVLPSPDYAAIFDDFLGDLIADEWAVVEGDTGHTQAITSGTNGVFRLTNSITTTPASAANQAVTGGLIKNWKADQGPGRAAGRLRLSARVKLQNVDRTAGNRMHAFIGFSDSGGAEFPAYDTGAGVISNATDLVGFLFSPGGDTGWSLVGCRADTDQLAVAGASNGPTANVYTTLEVEVSQGLGDTGGSAKFFIDGKSVGSIDSPLGSAVALSPWLGCWAQDTGDTVASYLDIDYVAISAPRDTGL